MINLSVTLFFVSIVIPLQGILVNWILMQSYTEIGVMTQSTTQKRGESTHTRANSATWHKNQDHKSAVSRNIKNDSEQRSHLTRITRTCCDRVRVHHLRDPDSLLPSGERTGPSPCTIRSPCVAFPWNSYWRLELDVNGWSDAPPNRAWYRSGKL
jgi:hypothetical protein